MTTGFDNAIQNTSEGDLVKCCSCKRMFAGKGESASAECYCPHCGAKNSANRLTLPVEAENTAVEFGFDEETQVRVDSGTDDGDGFRLAPEKNRPPATTSLTSQSAQSAAIAIDRVAEERHSAQAPNQPISRAVSVSRDYHEPIDLPSQRHYPTLESIQRIYRIFGYVVVMIMLPYLAYRLFAVIMSDEPDLIMRLVGFSQLGIPLLLGTVVFAGTAFAASEGIQLAMDIQSNTLTTARNARR